MANKLPAYAEADVARHLEGIPGWRLEEGAIMVLVTGQLTLVCGALFTGAAAYVFLCEQPARLA